MPSESIKFALRSSVMLGSLLTGASIMHQVLKPDMVRARALDTAMPACNRGLTCAVIAFAHARRRFRRWRAMHAKAPAVSHAANPSSASSLRSALEGHAPAWSSVWAALASGTIRTARGLRAERRRSVVSRVHGTR